MSSEHPLHVKGTGAERVICVQHTEEFTGGVICWPLSGQACPWLNGLLHALSCPTIPQSSHLETLSPLKQHFRLGKEKKNGLKSNKMQFKT